MSQVFLTGASGFVGQNVLNSLLAKNYTVRVALRKESQIKQFKTYFADKPVELELVLVSGDFSKTETFVPLLKGVEYVVHVASPLPFKSDDYKRDFIDPAVNATLSIMKAAKAVGTVKRVVMTLSFSTVATDYSVKYIDEDSWSPIDAKTDLGFLSNLDEFEAYSISKTLAEKAAWSFIEEEKPSFDLITILPTLVLGQYLIREKDEAPKNTVALLMGILTAGVKTTVGDGFNYIVDVADVAEAHANAIDPNVPGNKRVILTADLTNRINEAKEIAKEAFPSGPWNFGDYEGFNEVVVNNERSKSVLGIRYRSFKETILNTITQFVNP